MIRARRTGVTALAVLVIMGASPGWVQARPAPAGQSAAVPADRGEELPPNWSVTGEGPARKLVWRSRDRVPMGDARIGFYAGERLLGRPVQADDGRTFRLGLDGVRMGSGRDLQVRASGRRLDAPRSAADPAPGSGRRAPVTVPPRLPANSVDPGRPGGYRTVTGTYELPAVRLPGFAEPVEMRAVVVAPKDARGPRPLALFLHGRHSTCYTPQGDVSGAWPCPAGSKSIPSYRGYLRDQRLLASQGYVTVSVSANGVNAQDGDADDGGAQARSSLVRRHLARWADWSARPGTAPAAVRAAPAADMSRVLLVGHSRGGEGVNRAAMDSLYPPPADQDGARGPVRWRVRGTVLIGPTIFGGNPVADVPSVTILPGCDGDVSDLSGQAYVDGTRGAGRGDALHGAVYMVGANHNYFNSEWTPGQAQAPAEDDFWSDEQERDPVCSPGAPTRLTADQQHRAGASYIAAAARLFVAGDDRVRPLLDGSGRRAPSADPARVLTHAVGARRGAGFLPDGRVTVSGARLCSAVDPSTAKACLASETAGASPHFAQWETDREPGRRALALRWSAAGTPARIRPERPLSLAGAKALALRVIVPPNSRGTRLDVSVTDTSGQRRTLGRVTVDGLAGSDRTASYWAREVRVPIGSDDGAALDLRRVRSLELTPRTGSGRAWLMDAWAWRPGTPAVRAATLPRVDVGRLTVREGDSGVRTYRVPVRVSGPGSGQVRLFVSDPLTGEVTHRLVTVRRGSPAVEVPVRVEGNDRYGYDVDHTVFVKAVRSAVVGAHRGGVSVRNDDPMPTVSVAPVADRVTEGQPLRWRVSLSAVADTEIDTSFALRPVTGGPELSTKDVDPGWLLERTGESPDPQRPLSGIEGVYLWVSVPAGRSSAELTLPTVRDTVAEPPETVRVQESDIDEPRPGAPVLTGTVLDAS